MEKVIHVEGLSVKIDDREILSDVSFSALKGEITVIIGGSGSGKTTILRHLLGLDHSERGYISVLGKNISGSQEGEMNEMYHQLGVFYQNGALITSMTVGENVAMPLVHQSNLPKPLVKDIVMMKLGLVNLKEAYNLYPSQLSGGMLKRVALARAIAMDPPLIFCDEPGAGLDPVSLKSLDNLILNLRDFLGISIIMITHEVSSILRIADRIIFLDKGTVKYEGKTKEALSSDIQEVKEFFSVLDTEHAINQKS
ncbi:MAG: ATP-binding cassette domain-containing protein [Bacteroidales bacterium]